MPSRSVIELLQSTRPLLIGHRGCCALAPENTIPSFKLAIDAGADLIELDYHQSSDGVPMVFHDSTLDRTTNARKLWRSKRIRVQDKMAAEIQGLCAGSWFDRKFSAVRVPRLTEALDFICGKGAVPLIEHKSGDPETLIGILKERNLINRVVVISFDWKFLADFHVIAPEQVLGALGPPFRLVDGARNRSVSKRLTARWIERLGQTGARLIVWNRQVPTAAIEYAHRLDLKIWIYTINESGLACDLIDRGANGIITNDPFQIGATIRGLAPTRT